jgi:hypothetical protein
MELLCLLTDLMVAGMDAASPARNLMAFWHRKIFLQDFMLIFSYSCAEAVLISMLAERPC